MNISNILDQTYYKTIDPRSLSSSVVKSVVREILFVSQKELNKPTTELSVLDVGLGNGRYSFEIEKYVNRVTGVEPFFNACKQAIDKKREIHSKVNIFHLPIEKFRTRERYDLVISLTTIEHMPKARESFLQIFKLMRKGAIIYLTAPNKLWPFEYHYKLPFLSWLPLNLANYYVRIFGRGKSYEDSAYSKTYFGMKNFFDQFPCEYKFILPYDKDSLYLGCGAGGKIYKLIKNLGIFLIAKFPFFWIFSKGFIIIVKKK